MQPHRYCLITGASRGIGRDLARELAQHGYSLILIARDHVALRVLKDELHAYTPDIRLFTCDLSDRPACFNLVKQLQQEELNIDILINNAGSGLCERFDKMPLDSLLSIMDINMIGLTLLTRLLLPEMIKRKQGCIVNIASTAAYQPGPLMAVYYATKAYVLSFSEALREELRDLGISVTTVCPGPTNTDFKLFAQTSRSIFGVMPSFKVAQIIYRATVRKKRLVIPGLINRVLVIFSKLFPHILLMKIMKYLHKRNYHDYHKESARKF